MAVCCAAALTDRHRPFGAQGSEQDINPERCTKMRFSIREKYKSGLIEMKKMQSHLQEAFRKIRNGVRK
jgi:hypothetical protein